MVLLPDISNARPILEGVSVLIQVGMIHCLLFGALSREVVDVHPHASSHPLAAPLGCGHLALRRLEQQLRTARTAIHQGHVAW